MEGDVVSKLTKGVGAVLVVGSAIAAYYFANFIIGIIKDPSQYELVSSLVNFISDINAGKLLLDTNESIFLNLEVSAPFIAMIVLITFFRVITSLILGLLNAGVQLFRIDSK
jgi:hypothetical protein